MTGYSVGEYIRCRRLYEAARAIVQTKERIVDIALRFGYDTQESFTKAFCRFHGASPTAVRRDPAKMKTYLPFQIRIEIIGGAELSDGDARGRKTALTEHRRNEKGNAMKKEFVVSPMWGFKVIGFERIFDGETAYQKIPEFWDEICEKYCNHTIYAGLAPSCPEEQAIIDNCIGEYGVCIDDLGGGKFRYLIAGRYCGGQVPESMRLVEIPGGEWAKFKCVGAIPDALQALNTYVYEEWLPGNAEYELTGNYNLEWYSCDGNQTDEDYESGIWLPVRRKETV